MQELLSYIPILLCTIIFGVQLSSAQEPTFDVTRFGAVGDGKANDTKVISLNFTFILFYQNSCILVSSSPLKKIIIVISRILNIDN